MNARNRIGGNHEQWQCTLACYPSILTSSPIMSSQILCRSFDNPRNNSPAEYLLYLTGTIESSKGILKEVDMVADIVMVDLVPRPFSPSIINNCSISLSHHVFTQSAKISWGEISTQTSICKKFLIKYALFMLHFTFRWTSAT